MGGVFGNNIRLSIFGESHGKAIGIVVDGLPPGIKLDLKEIEKEMMRRRPGKDQFSTGRVEKDEFEILSGYFEDKTTGTPLCAIIYNTDKKSRDYDEIRDLLRPSHGDYTGKLKYKGYNDYRGGGHFSGRITAPVVFAGAIAKQILEEKGIQIGSHIQRIGDIEDKKFDYVDISEDLLSSLRNKEIPTIDEEKSNMMKNSILRAKEEKDSVGGIIECAMINVPPGLGNPFFDSVESMLSHLLFSIPGIKGVEFGDGFDISKMRGSLANDEFYIEEENIRTYTNHNGGILAGITNGMPIIFKVAVKPTPSIGKPQRTVNFRKNENTTIEIKGRHDPCIVQRAIPVVEGCGALVVLDFLLYGRL